MEGYRGGLRNFILSSETSIRLNNLDIFADSIEIQVGFSDLDADLSPYVSRELKNLCATLGCIQKTTILSTQFVQLLSLSIGRGKRRIEKDV